ncbi:hypothetical protein V1477_018155 [Vespula maculifrons]|uniref:Uncharacterized protein n=1 Tax=Vespula maculifrons TaxID=7453 RepID=A0ABD2AYN1_VESMC
MTISGENGESEKEEILFKGPYGPLSSARNALKETTSCITSKCNDDSIGRVNSPRVTIPVWISFNARPRAKTQKRILQIVVLSFQERSTLVSGPHRQSRSPYFARSIKPSETSRSRPLRNENFSIIGSEKG